MPEAQGDHEAAEHKKKRDAMETHRSETCGGLDERVRCLMEQLASMGDVKPGDSQSRQSPQCVQRRDTALWQGMRDWQRTRFHNAERSNKRLNLRAGISIQLKEINAQARLASRLKGKRPERVVFQLVKNGCCQR